MNGFSRFLAVVCLFVPFAALPTPAVAQHSDDSPVVRLQIKTNRAPFKAGLGTGFLISPDGNILTCYHVVQDASEIHVFYKDTFRNTTMDLSRVTVVSVSPGFDLALLKVEGLPRGAKYLNLAKTSSDSGLSNTALETVGFPGELMVSMHLYPHATRDGVVSSKQFVEVSKYFAYNIDVITIDTSIYGGMSGSPLLSKDGVVGVISGSFNQGGGIGWAIPVKYMDRLKPMGTTPDRTVWPTLTLMSMAWRSLRSEVGYPTDLIAAYAEYQKAIPSAPTQAQMYKAAILPYVTKAKEILAQVDREIRTRGANFVLDDDTKLYVDLDMKLDDFKGDIDMDSGDEELAEKYEKAANSSSRLADELAVYMLSFDTTPESLEARRYFAAQLQAVSDETENSLSLIASIAGVKAEIELRRLCTSSATAV